MRKLPRPSFHLVYKYFIESLPECPIIGGGEGSFISGNLGGESW